MADRGTLKRVSGRMVEDSASKPPLPDHHHHRRRIPHLGVRAGKKPLNQRAAMRAFEPTGMRELVQAPECLGLATSSCTRPCPPWSALVPTAALLAPVQKRSFLEQWAKPPPSAPISVPKTPSVKFRVSDRFLVLWVHAHRLRTDSRTLSPSTQNYDIDSRPLLEPPALALASTAGSRQDDVVFDNL